MGYTHGIKWTDDMVKSEIENITKALNVNRMPTNKEIIMVTGSSSLSNKISKSGGFYFWAEKLGLKLKESDTGKGRYHEFLIKDILSNRGYKVEKMTTRHPYDLLVNDSIKIDVKVSGEFKSIDNNYKTHSFNLGKKNHNCDIFILLCLKEDSDIDRILVIPSKFIMGTKQVCIGKDSKYNNFNGTFGYIDEFDKFYKNLRW